MTSDAADILIGSFLSSLKYMIDSQRGFGNRAGLAHHDLPILQFFLQQGVFRFQSIHLPALRDQNLQKTGSGKFF